MYVCACVRACIFLFAQCITSCVSLTGPVPRWPLCHATLLPLRPTGSDTCEMLTWSVAAPSRASGCCSFSHSSLAPWIFLFFFVHLSERPQKAFVPLCSPFRFRTTFFLFFPLQKWLRKLQPISQVSEQVCSTLLCCQRAQEITVHHF